MSQVTHLMPPLDQAECTAHAVRAALREVERHTVSARAFAESLAPVHSNEDTSNLLFVSREIENLLIGFREYWDDQYLDALDDDLDAEERP